MSSDRGIFIALEGSDGSGKATQFNLLKERLQATGYEVAVFDFPRYANESGSFVRKYLAGTYGPATDISPYTASLFYALDRFDAKADIETALEAGKIVLANRYAGSNMAHQGAKFDNPAEKRGFFIWEDNLEFQLLGIPRPDISYFLRVPAEISQKLLRQRAHNSATKLDGHELDIDFLKKSLATYDLMCQLFPKDFKAIDCTADGELLSIADINNRIWSKLKPLLPADKPNPSHSVVVTLDSSLDSKNNKTQFMDDLDHTFQNISLFTRLQLERLSRVQNLNQRPYWHESGYRYYTPAGLPQELQAKYKQSNEKLAGLHEQARNRLVRFLESKALSGDGIRYSADELLTPLTPLSALVSAPIRVSKNDIRRVASELLTQDSDEIQWAAKQLYLAARQAWPARFKQPLESDEGPIALNNIIAKIAEEYLPSGLSSGEPVKLLEAHPRLEFSLLADSIYPYSNLPLDEIAEEVSNWPYTQKYQSLKEAARQPEVLSKVRYKLDIISDQITISRIIDSANSVDAVLQVFTPRYGYDVPEIIEEAGIDDLYDQCFDESLSLYALLQSAERYDIAPYVTLMGHKVRWQLNLNAVQLGRFAKDKDLTKDVTVKAIIEQIADSHPLLTEIIKGAESTVSSPAKNGKSRVKPYHQPAKKRRKK
jgi:dTMP kinase